jgi:CRP/FNR family cyclic AMP-dependent transcriptional regulator
VLVPEGRRDICLWLVASGLLTASVTQPSGGRAIIEFLGPGDTFGEDWLDERPSGPDSAGTAAEVRSLTGCRVLVWPGWAAADAYRGDPEVRHWMVARLLGRLDRARRAMAHTLGGNVAERVEHLLMDLAPVHGRPVAGGVRIEVPLSQETLAAAVGATRESVNRAIRSLVDRGMLRHHGHLYTLAGAGPGQAFRV